MYCFTERYTVARDMALRVHQPTPWRARVASVSSERVLFCSHGKGKVSRWKGFRREGEGLYSLFQPIHVGRVDHNEKGEL